MSDGPVPCGSCRGRTTPRWQRSRHSLLADTLGTWAVALVGGALVVASAPSASIYRCVDGWTNPGQAHWLRSSQRSLFSAHPLSACAAWLVIGHRGSARQRWAAVAVAVAIPLVTIALAFRFLPDVPSTGTCFD